MTKFPSSILILGFARSGQSAANFFLKNGTKVFVYDDDCSKKEAALKLGCHWYENDVPIEGVLQSPVIAPTHTLSDFFRKKNIPVWCDVGWYRYFFPDVKVIGITGTNGKSTSTALMTHVLKELGYEVVMGGNFGIPVFDLPVPSKNGYVVLELSSYQLELCDSLNLDMAGLLNISEDHLERHGTMQAYIEAKERIFLNAKKCVISLDDPYSKKIYENYRANGYNFDTASLRDIHPYDEFRYLIGIHNHQNIAFVYKMCELLGLPQEIIYDGIRTFKGLEHRLEKVAHMGKITFINDSKATNADAARWALEACESIFWLSGGADKSDGIDKLVSYCPKIVRSYTFGKAKDRFYETLKGCCDVTSYDTLDQAFTKAYEDALMYEKPCTILLSPACASFDQFCDFEHRGNFFKSLVNEALGK